MKNYVHPKIPDSIRIQLIKETFADKIEQYCREKDKAKGDIKVVTFEERLWVKKMCRNRNNLVGNQLCHGLCTANR
ncbi:MAG: hypothetical protein WA125_15060 [Desulfosporosinus sp.]